VRLVRMAGADIDDARVDRTELAGIEQRRVGEWLVANVPGLVGPVEFTLRGSGCSCPRWR
jgi:hypothetical protein